MPSPLAREGQRLGGLHGAEVREAGMAGVATIMALGAATNGAVGAKHLPYLLPHLATPQDKYDTEPHENFVGDEVKPSLKDCTYSISKRHDKEIILET